MSSVRRQVDILSGRDPDFDHEPDWLAAERQAAMSTVVDEPAAEVPPEPPPPWAERILDGRTWLTTGNETPEALWGDDEHVLWVKDQPVTIAGPQGAGKTVVGEQLLLGALCVGDGELLGLPIAPIDGRALYLAADRPDQARLSMLRMLNRTTDMDVLEHRLRVWPGPPPADLAKNPLTLWQMAQASEARLVLLDSLKDVALKLSDDDVGAALNQAIQHCIADGIQVISLHHPRKLGGGATKDQPRDLDDIYGSTWLTGGSGSVIYLHPGEGGTYTLAQLKSPVGQKIELSYEHDHRAGTIRPVTAPDLLTIVDQAGQDGITIEHAARCLLRIDTVEPKHRKSLGRKLKELTDEGAVEKIPGDAVGHPDRYRSRT